MEICCSPPHWNNIGIAIAFEMNINAFHSFMHSIYSLKEKKNNIFMINVCAYVDAGDSDVLFHSINKKL